MNRLYAELASWWLLLSPPEEYEGEAADLLPRLGVTPGAVSAGQPTLLELGSGGGSLAFHLKRHFRLTLTDIAPGMLAVSRAINPECEHLVGDMFTLRLGRRPVRSIPTAARCSSASARSISDGSARR